MELELEIIKDIELIQLLELDSEKIYYQEIDNTESSTVYWYDEIGALHYHVF